MNKNNLEENDYNTIVKKRVHLELKRLYSIDIFFDQYPGGINSNLSYTFITKNIKCFNESNGKTRERWKNGSCPTTCFL